ncbi:MAG TPA: helix-turn-helix domain-containing protein [Burkholderiaceae bacterium]|nr:helix-turn-helix domain-containing protein [Burkholderiaceae bacterium]
MESQAAPTALPAQPFFSTPQQRLALARQRYFEEGVRPSGLVGEGVIQSWSRCVQARRDPDEALAFDVVTHSRVQSALMRSRLLLQNAALELSALERTLAGTACAVLLTDPQGVVVHAARTGPDPDGALMRVAGRVGVCLSEHAIGTNAPGVTAHTGLPSVVLGGEHFFNCAQVLQCAAAPIRDIHGRIAGVLDVSCEGREFGFDAAAVVGLHATAIENRLLCAQSTEHIVVRMQTSLALLDTPLEGLLGVTGDGRIAWLNGAAARLLGIRQPAPALDAEAALGLDLHGLNSTTRRLEATPHRLPSGLNVWLLARMQSHNGAPGTVYGGSGWAGARDAPTRRSAASAGEPVLTLRDTDLHLVEQAVQACNGNVSQAARRLGVSRGLVYRHLKHARTR